ncbi:MAG: GTPase ObgE [Pseudomonadota bacterium]
MKFLDEAKIYLKSGNGGDGCVSFRREKYVEFGGPDGGHGGRGGNIYVKAINNLNTLIDYRYRQHFKAKTGQSGMGRNRNGASADDITLEVPLGTQLFDETGQFMLFDLTKDGQVEQILAGGCGGVGNAAFKASTNQSPRTTTQGETGQELWVWLKLKMIADCGLVGMPNAGKSTFLSVVSNAKPKIADYPFTTLKPQLGVATHHYKEIVIADIPGLIAGASSGSGLGDKFLKHIERTGVIIHLVDGSDKNFIDNYRMIRRELAIYSPDLAQRKEVIGLTKADLVNQSTQQERSLALTRISNSTVTVMSSVTGFNKHELLNQVLNNL